MEARGRKHCQDDEKALMLVLHEEGYSLSAIAERVGRTKSAVHRWLTRHRRENTVATRPRTGRPRCSTREEDERIVESASTSPFTTRRQILENSNVRVHLNTISRRLHEAGIKARVPATVPDITENHAQQRLNFAVEYLYENWRNAIFSDEKVFYSNANNPRLVYRPVGLRYNKNYVVTDKSSGRVSIAYWGWMSLHGPGDLVEITEKLTALQYRNILEEYVLPQAVAADEKLLFVQDNSAIHTAKIIKEWFVEHREIITLVNWPAKSPDLNPIENLWSSMVSMWDNENMRRNRIGLRNQAEEIWGTLTKEYCQNLVNSMPRRLEAVIESGGYHTKY